MFHLTSRKSTSKSNYVDWHDLFVDAEPSKRVVGKRQTVAYERSRLADSVHKVCMRTFGFSGEAQLTAQRVCQDVEGWLRDKEEVTKSDIKRHAAAALRQYNPRAAYRYLPLKEYAVEQDTYGTVRL